MHFKKSIHWCIEKGNVINSGCVRLIYAIRGGATGCLRLDAFIIILLNNNNNNNNNNAILYTDGLYHARWFSIGHCENITRKI